jgi:hypothetical protein
MAAIPLQKPAAPVSEETLESRFHRLADIWHAAVAHHSSSSIRNNHPAYQEIIGMGPAVFPLLLADLEKSGRHWFWALKVITGSNPVPTEDRGNIAKVTQAWLGWGKEQGYRW